MRFFNYAIGLVFVGCLMLSGGCGESIKSAEDIRKSWNNTNMERITSLYALYQRSHIYRGPADEAKFKEYIQSLDEGTLGLVRVDINKLDDLFVSERDSEPFEIRYGVRGSDRDPPVPVVFEKTGVDGVRKVGFNARKIIGIGNEQEYQDLLSGKQSTADPAPAY